MDPDGNSAVFLIARESKLSLSAGGSSWKVCIALSVMSDKPQYPAVRRSSHGYLHLRIFSLMFGERAGTQPSLWLEHELRIGADVKHLHPSQYLGIQPRLRLTITMKLVCSYQVAQLGKKALDRHEYAK